MVERWAWVIGAWVSLVGVAHAQSGVVVMVPPEVESASRPDTAERAERALGEALLEQGYRLISEGQAAASVGALSSDGKLLGETPSACTSDACAQAYQAFFEAALAVRLRVSGTLVTVTLVDGDETRWAGSGRLGPAEVEEVARTALSQALAWRKSGALPRVSVQGVPAGAEVWIDGERVGALPYEGTVTPGEHTLLVQAQGMISVERTLSVTLGEDGAGSHVEQVQLRPEPLPAASLEEPEPAMVESAMPAPPREPARGTAAYDWALGGSLVAGGLALALIGPVLGTVKAGQCSDGTDDTGACEHTYRTVPWAIGVQAAGGAALVGAGAAVMALRPIRVWMQADRKSAQLVVGGNL